MEINIYRRTPMHHYPLLPPRKVSNTGWFNLPETKSTGEEIPISSKQHGNTDSSTSTAKRISLLDLPFDIRYLIFKFALYSSTPLIAWAGMRLEQIAGWHQFDWEYDDTPQTFAMRPYLEHALPVERLITNLNLVSRQVSQEARATFWSQNTFRFLGEWTRSSILEWLTSIGDENREYLRNLELMMREPSFVWQISDAVGTRIKLPTYRSHVDVVEYQNSRQRLYPWSRYLTVGSPSEGMVENISPVVEERYSDYRTWVEEQERIEHEIWLEEQG